MSFRQSNDLPLEYDTKVALQEMERYIRENDVDIFSSSGNLTPENLRVSQDLHRLSSENSISKSPDAVSAMSLLSVQYRDQMQTDEEDSRISYGTSQESTTDIEANPDSEKKNNISTADKPVIKSNNRTHKNCLLL